VKLYTYWRSTSSYRVRIALALKNLNTEHVFVHLVRKGGEQNTDYYRALNPQRRVPSFVLDDGTVVTQSSAIIEYLEEVFPTPSLLSIEPFTRAKARAVAAIIACDIHPLHNVSTLNYLRLTLGQPEVRVTSWITTWISQGFDAIESIIGESGYCFGSEPGLADVYLLPQLYAARRFGVLLDRFPKILRVEQAASDHGAFRIAHPLNQPDAE